MGLSLKDFEAIGRELNNQDGSTEYNNCTFNFGDFEKEKHTDTYGGDDVIDVEIEEQYVRHDEPSALEFLIGIPALIISLPFVGVSKIYQLWQQPATQPVIKQITQPVMKQITQPTKSNSEVFGIDESIFKLIQHIPHVQEVEEFKKDFDGHFLDNPQNRHLLKKGA